MQSSSNSNNTNSTNNTNNNANEVLNPSVNIQERTIIIENIKKFLIEHLPADQVATPQKAHELAVRFESHVAYNTSTKEQYQGMISEKLRMIKMKASEISSTQQPSSSSTNLANLSGPQIPLTPQEIVQISNRLQQIRPQIPQIDKLLTLHSKLTNPPANSLEMIKKLTDCRNILVTQIEIAVANRKNFALNLTQLNLLIEQVQRLFNSLVSKMKESAGVAATTGSNNTNNANSNNNTTGGATNNNASINNNVNINNSNINGSSINTPNSTSTATITTAIPLNNPLSIISSTIASSSASSASINSNAKTKTKPPPNSINFASFEKSLQQRLSIPSDLNDRVESSNNSDWIKSFISINSNSNLNRKTKLSSLTASHLKRRNRILSAELKALQKEFTFQFLIQETGLGNLNLLISTEEHRLIFQILPKYPFEQLIYRIESKVASKGQSTTTTKPFMLPRQMEAKTGPFTLSTILRRFQQFQQQK